MNYYYFFGGGEWKWLVDESGWWVMTYLLHCSFPIHQFFPSDDWHDCYAEPTTPPFSLQPPPLLPSLPLFFFILARKEGMLTQREEKKTYIYLGGTCLFLEKREVWKNPHVGLSDKPHFFSTNPNERLRRMLALLNWSSTCPCMAPLIVSNTHTPSFLFSPLHAIYYTYPFAFVFLFFNF